MEILTGALLIGLGAAAIGLPWITSLSVAYLVACAFAAGGIVHLFRAIMAREYRSTALQALVGLLYLVIAVWIVRHPLWSVATLSLVVAATLAMEGFITLVTYFVTGGEASIWVPMIAIVTIALGFVAWSISIVAPASLVAAVVGVNLAANGFGRIMEAVEARHIREA